MDKEQSTAEVGRQFAQCARLIAATSSRLERLPGPPRRLVVVESPFRGSGVCSWLDGTLARADAAEWLQDVVEDQHAELRAGTTGAPELAAIASAIELVEAAG